MKTTLKTTLTAAEKIWLWQFALLSTSSSVSHPENRYTEIMKSSAVKQCQPAGYRQLQAVNIFRIYYKLLTALTAVTSCRQLWQVLQAFASSDSCYKLLPAVTSCCQFWQLLQAVASFDSCYKLLPALTAVTSCCQLWQLLQAVASFESCY